MAGPKHVTLFRQKGLWYVSYYCNGERVRESTGLNNKKLAEELRQQREREMILGTVEIGREVTRGLCDPARREAVLALLTPNRSIRVLEAIIEYLNHSSTYKRPKTVAGDRGRLCEFFEHVAVHYLQEVSTKSINEYLTWRKSEDGLSLTTLLRIREVLHALFEWAKKQAYLSGNPVADVSRPRLPERDIEYLTMENIDRALSAMKGDRIEAAVAVAIYAGLRREEICWLTWDDVDLEKRLIRVRSKTIDGESWTPKTGRNRTVPVSDALSPFLAAQQLRKGRSTWVFTTPEGCRWDPDNLSHRLRDLMEGAGLKWGFLHFRHTFGSMLAQKGVSLFKIARLMGNSPAIAERHYAALAPQEMHDEVEFGGCKNGKLQKLSGE